MASRRKRLFFTLQYTDSTDSNRIKPITSGNLYIMPGGAWVNDTDSLSGTITLNVHDVGELTTAADVVHILDENAAEIATGVISSVKWVTGTGDQVALTITGGSLTDANGAGVQVINGTLIGARIEVRDCQVDASGNFGGAGIYAQESDLRLRWSTIADNENIGSGGSIAGGLVAFLSDVVVADIPGMDLAVNADLAHAARD